MNRTYGIIFGAFLLAGASGCKAVKDRDGNDCEEATGEDAKCTTGSGTTSTADSETSTSDNGGDTTSTGTTT